VADDRIAFASGASPAGTPCRSLLPSHLRSCATGRKVG
jgi:hypothetical protein